tara:strand:+ start:215 stop:1018 length:804 start_codon:yes stop_codon:yes gene_type:complete
MSSLTSNVIFDVSSCCGALPSVSPVYDGSLAVGTSTWTFSDEENRTVGSKVTNVEVFLRILSEALASHDTDGDGVVGQHFVELPVTDELLESVTSGVGKRQGRTEADYVLRDHRGNVGAYLKRECALPAESVRVLVYTLEAYCADPEVTAEEAERVTRPFVIQKDGAKFWHPQITETTNDAEKISHVIVAVLADAGPKSPLSPRRFAANFAGNNVMLERRDAIEATVYSGASASSSEIGDALEALRLTYKEAAEVTEYDEKYCVVAD